MARTRLSWQFIADNLRTRIVCILTQNTNDDALVTLAFSLWPLRNYGSLGIVLNRFAHFASPGYTTCDSWAAAQSLGTDVCF